MPLAASDALQDILRRRRKRRLQREEKQASRRRAAALTALTALSLVLALGLLAAGLFIRQLMRGLPPVSEVSLLLDPPDGRLLSPTHLYARDGQTILFTFSPLDGLRPYLPLIAVDAPHLPDALVQASLLLEEADFWHSPGYALSGWDDPQRHPTLAQKLVSDLLLWNEAPTLQRALRERILAAQLTQRYGRAQVLEWYLNSADYGHNAFGAESAARLYFGKSAAELSLAEAALLAGVGHTPALNPLDAPQAAYEHGQETLALMHAAGVIDDKAYAAALLEHPRLSADGPRPSPLADLALAQAALPPERLARGGLDIVTSLDATLQAQMACLLEAVRAPEQTCAGAAALPFKSAFDVRMQALALDPQSGQILAMASAPGDTWQSWLPAGDVLYPFIYLTAFTRGFNPSSLVWDLPDETVADWDGDYYGPMRARVALVNGDQTPSAHVLAQMGSENVRRFAALHGLRLSDADLISGEALVNPLRLAQAYGVWAAGGVLSGQEVDGALRASLLLTIQDKKGGLWQDARQPQTQAVLSPQLAWLMTDILRDDTVRRFPAADMLALNRPVAVKMAHTPDGKGVWVIGYTPSRLVLLWMESKTRLNDYLPAGLWRSLMQTVLQNAPPTQWDEPPGLSHLIVCDPSGLLPAATCPQTVKEIFLAGNEPIETDTLYQSYEINRETGLLATVFTPPEMVETRIYMNVPPAARDWARANGWTPPPDTYDTVAPPRRDADAFIASPDLFACVSGQTAILGSARSDDFSWYRLQAGFGVNPSQWTEIAPPQTEPVTNGRLALWDTRALTDGLYALQLLVVRKDGQVKSALTQVTVDNTPPEIMRVVPSAGARLQGDSARSVWLHVEASDNLALRQALFYVDGKRVAALDGPPWSTLVEDLPAGIHQWRVVVHDCAGNSAEQTISFETQP